MQEPLSRRERCSVFGKELEELGKLRTPAVRDYSQKVRLAEKLSRCPHHPGGTRKWCVLFVCFFCRGEQSPIALIKPRWSRPGRYHRTRKRTRLHQPNTRFNDTPTPWQDRKEAREKSGRPHCRGAAWKSPGHYARLCAQPKFYLVASKEV